MPKFSGQAFGSIIEVAVDKDGGTDPHAHRHINKVAVPLSLPEAPFGQRHRAYAILDDRRKAVLGFEDLLQGNAVPSRHFGPKEDYSTFSIDHSGHCHAEALDCRVVPDQRLHMVMDQFQQVVLTFRDLGGELSEGTDVAQQVGYNNADVRSTHADAQKVSEFRVDVQEDPAPSGSRRSPATLHDDAFLLQIPNNGTDVAGSKVRSLRQAGSGTVSLRINQARNGDNVRLLHGSATRLASHAGNTLYI